MFTETELREAMQHSAERADAVPDAYRLRAAAAHQRRHRGIRIGLRVAAAASVAAVVTASTLVAHALSRHGQGEPSIRATNSALTAAPLHVPVSGTAVVNLFTIGASRPEYDYSTTFEAAHSFSLPPLADSDGANYEVLALPASAQFDPATRFTHAHRVRVVGTVVGYYGDVNLYEQFGHPELPPSSAIGWQTASGAWLFVTTTYGGHASQAILLKAYLELQAELHPSPARLPLRTGWLPADVRLDDVSVGPAAETVVHLVGGQRGITVLLNPAKKPAAKRGPGPETQTGEPSASRQIGQYILTVYGVGYDQASVQRVLDSIQVAKDLSGSADWWTIQQALG